MRPAKLTREQVWVLYQLGRDPCSVKQLSLPRDHWHSGMNTEWHESTIEAVLGGLFALRDHGALEFDEEDFAGLTEAGGLLWEEVFKPDWSRSVWVDYSPEGPEDAAVQRRAIYAMQWEPLLNRLFDSLNSIHEGGYVLLGTNRVETGASYRPLYWKELTGGISLYIELAKRPDDFYSYYQYGLLEARVGGKLWTWHLTYSDIKKDFQPA